MFRFATTVKLYDTDASGALFFAQQFRLTHDACEAFLATTGLFVQGKPIMQLPVVHAEADYAARLCWGEAVVVEVQFLLQMQIMACQLEQLMLIILLVVAVVQHIIHCLV